MRIVVSVILLAAIASRCAARCEEGGLFRRVDRTCANPPRRRRQRRHNLGSATALLDRPHLEMTGCGRAARSCACCARLSWYPRAPRGLRPRSLRRRTHGYGSSFAPGALAIRLANRSLARSFLGEVGLK